MKIDIASLLPENGSTIVDLGDILELLPSTADNDILETIDDDTIVEYAESNNLIDYPEPETPHDAFRALAEGDYERCADLLRDQFPELGSFSDSKKLAKLLYPQLF